MPNKLTYNYVFNFIKEHGDELISSEYVNNKTRLEIQCHKCYCPAHRKYGKS